MGGKRGYRGWRVHRQEQIAKSKKYRADKRFGGDTSRNGEVVSTLDLSIMDDPGARPAIAEQYRSDDWRF